MKRIVETMLCLAVLCIHEAITPQTQRLGKVSDHFTIVMPQNAVGIVRLK